MQYVEETTKEKSHEIHYFVIAQKAFFCACTCIYVSVGVRKHVKDSFNSPGIDENQLQRNLPKYKLFRTFMYTKMCQNTAMIL